MSLPSLRADLQLSTAAPALDGSPRWTLADPVRGRYFKLGAAAMRLLRHWSLGDPEQVLRAANREPGLPLDGVALEQLLEFLRGHDLISALDPSQRASYSLKAAAQRQSLWQILLHQYLFFRIPLWRPDAFLNRAWPWLERFGPRVLRYGLPATLGLGVSLVSRDWQRFIATFPHLFSLGGALAFGVALFFAKLCHEFGHAFMAKRAGCRVQSMGVAFMVLLPMFYTDVSDAWRVNDRRARLLIGAGGVLAELVLACIALLAWSLLPDGPGRTAAFMLASATWITTLVINLNPFMRFDGYFLLSDFWEVDNLQGRAFALCRWRLREFLFGYAAPAPEPWSPKMQRRLLIWGYGAWLWRAALFFGIALAVYHLFFKVLGIFLMLVELVWFIFLPILNEWRQWWSRREQAHAPRVLLSGLALLGLLLLLALPWRSAVELPTMLEAGRASALHAPVAARVKTVNVHDGQIVAQGEVLIELESPDLDSRQAIVRREIQIQQLQMRRQAGRSETAADAGIVEQRLAEAVAEYRGLAAQRERLLLRAPHGGKVRDLLPQLTVGRWLSTKDPLARVVEDGARLRGYLAEAELWRVAPGASGRFIADDPMHPAIKVQLSEIDTNGVAYVDQEALTSDHHGPIAVRRDQHQRAEPVQAQYGARLSILENTPTPVQPLRGIVVLQGSGESLLGVAWRRLAALGVRESGF
ncbi:MULTISPECIES: HlyD family efflux transporter periplasmic adaptor subunit [Gammaproteobacteria]|uniref:HlyD family efflux transporter periplasmic adaptor subunit n=1 Tax=Gammaproteobacteria TaxID=1236 RepID=UPI001913A617|nr:MULTISPECIES: biotin/lipoyl-binding protein [Gammaproteobacteria]MBK5304994.1 HlyD family efflux transporter periplasmic adaptor subunit [Bacillus sp. TH86]MBK5324763.1 HlyD family efflux transporter periplasmic adaptor subunit [Bacillus sp. TH59]MBK5339713.1 HlyD family efflux transporter periplasmic adaptor subunit [Bacillus sp. TH57]MBK5313759.1 HlyD family efflux transporter periplasmic adaptor subunit [Pseudomonas sp. TH71]MBK5319259.1 HlyD family efflux transporter periplasmic adaptor